MRDTPAIPIFVSASVHSTAYSEGAFERRVLMELGMIGLGRMGAAMTKRLLAAGHTVVAYDQDKAAVARSVADGATGAVSLDSLVTQLATPRAVWVMVPAGDAASTTIERVARLLKSDDVLIDGGNSNFRDTIQRAFSVQKSGTHFLDVGTSGGIWGLTEGYCLMIGGDEAVVKRLQPLFEALAPARNRGWAHVGPNGAGHFAKMVHNGIEYGLMQAYSEGFALLEKNKDFNFDLPK